MLQIEQETGLKSVLFEVLKQLNTVTCFRTFVRGLHDLDEKFDVIQCKRHSVCILGYGSLKKQLSPLKVITFRRPKCLIHNSVISHSRKVVRIHELVLVLKYPVLC